MIFEIIAWNLTIGLKSDHVLAVGTDNPSSDCQEMEDEASAALTLV